MVHAIKSNEDAVKLGRPIIADGAKLGRPIIADGAKFGRSMYADEAASCANITSEIGAKKFLLKVLLCPEGFVTDSNVVKGSSRRSRGGAGATSLAMVSNIESNVVRGGMRLYANIAGRVSMQARRGGFEFISEFLSDILTRIARPVRQINWRDIFMCVDTEEISICPPRIRIPRKKKLTGLIDGCEMKSEFLSGIILVH